MAGLVPPHGGMTAGADSTKPVAMDTVPLRSADLPQAVEIVAPAAQALPLVFASPHSGREYPQSFVEQAALDPQTLRRSEDSFVDELFAAVTAQGAPLLRALFPRAYIDPNREPWELDPSMFAEPLPDFVNVRSPRVAAGLGTVPRVVASGAEIYGHRLLFAEAERRVEQLYRPYHAALQRLIDDTLARFGHCVLVDCHSMPSVGRPLDKDNGLSRVDFVLGDCFGAACAPAVIRAVEESLRGDGYRVVRNAPYAGGFTTRHYGRPREGVHALQIETNRRLYMNESNHTKTARFPRIAADLGKLAAVLAAIPAAELRPR